MKNVFFIVFALVTYSINAQQGSVAAFNEKWENSKNYLLEIAQSMPEHNYGYKPTEREMSFKEQLIHIRQNMDWLGKTYFDADITKVETENINKEELIKAITESFDAVKIAVIEVPDDKLEEKVDFFKGEKSKLQILNLLQDHVTHHRGQLIVYLNLNNIKPPKYVGW
ncbi:DinB family protein [Joostella atrarenae]|uniref:DinB family protein n=1 Tax=Joostella atrarenae TaxID=679257 RepID=A0ABS9IZW7_9FLAO|nr:DinB family protein [Joostella atrarenae]MCF8713718.1 DinB family protein [Joostella atrarenae]